MVNEEQTVNALTTTLLLAIGLMWGAVFIQSIRRWASMHRATQQDSKTLPPRKAPPPKSSGAKDKKGQQKSRHEPQTDSRTRSCTGCFNRVSERQYNYRQLQRHCLMVKRKRNLSTGLCRCVRRMPPPPRMCANCQKQTLHYQQIEAERQLEEQKLSSPQGRPHQQQNQSALIFRKTGFREHF